MWVRFDILAVSMHTTSFSSTKTCNKIEHCLENCDVFFECEQFPEPIISKQSEKKRKKA